MLDNVNAIKVCPTDSGAEGCRTNPYAWDGTAPGFTLSNGAFVALATWRDCGSAPHQGVAFYMDWNGNEGPNTLGDDLLTLMTVVYTGYTKPRGTVTVFCNPSAAEQTMYEAMFQ